MERNSINYIFIACGLIFAIIIAFNIGNIKKGFLHIFGGDIDKVEFAGIIFLTAFIWMIYKEGTRDHEWSYFSDTYIFFVAGATLTGLGLNKAIDAVKQIKGVDTTETKVEINNKGVSKMETKTAKTTKDNEQNEDSEAPK